VIERYQGKEGLGALLNEMRRQFLVDGNTDIAKMLVSATQVIEFLPGAVLFAEGDRGGDLFFILAGQVSVRKGDQEINTCPAGVHVGEIGLLEPFKGRSASVVAIDTVVVAQVSSQKFTTIADENPVLWRRMALELAHRLVKSQDAI
jgi:CRP/FNR family cyclic AMP-dependent transcriptional regulator